MHNSNQHHSFINSQVAELLSNLAISRRSTLSGSTVKCCSGLQQNFYFATANVDDFLNLADTLAIRSTAWESGKSTAGRPFYVERYDFWRNQMTCRQNSSTKANQLDKKLAWCTAQKRACDEISMYLANCDSIGLKTTGRLQYRRKSEVTVSVFCDRQKFIEVLWSYGPRIQ